MNFKRRKSAGELRLPGRVLRVVAVTPIRERYGAHALGCRQIMKKMTLPQLDTPAATSRTVAPAGPLRHRADLCKQIALEL